MTYADFHAMIKKEIDLGLYVGEDKDLAFFMVCISSIMMYGTPKEFLFECECYERR